MGCGASAPQPCTVEQMEEMCKDACKDMEVVCVIAAFAKPEQIKIAPPASIVKMRANLVSMKAQAAKIQEDKPKEAPAPAAGGLMGGLTAMVSAVGDKAESLTGAVAGKALAGLADVLEKALEKVEKPFDEVGKDICTSKKAEMQKIFVDYINAYNFQNAIKTVRGEAPWNAEQYSKVPGDSISKAMLGLAQKPIAEALTAATKDALMKHDVTAAWKSLYDAYNGTYDALAGISSVADMEKLGITKIEMDLETEVINAIYTKLGEMMGAEEAATRQNGTGKDVTQPAIFAKVFSPAQLMQSDYMAWKNKTGVL